MARVVEGREELDSEVRWLLGKLSHDELGFSYAEGAWSLGKLSADAARMTVSRAVLRHAQEARSWRASG